jgi:hypothetical protein
VCDSDNTSSAAGEARGALATQGTSEADREKMLRNGLCVESVGGSHGTQATVRFTVVLCVGSQSADIFANLTLAARRPSLGGLLQYPLSLRHLAVEQGHGEHG